MQSLHLLATQASESSRMLTTRKDGHEIEAAVESMPKQMPMGDGEIYPQVEMLLLMQKGLLMPLDGKHATFVNDLMIGNTSRFMKFAKSTHIMPIIQANTVNKEILIRHLSLTQDRCSHLFSDGHGEVKLCPAIVFAIPISPLHPNYGRVWHKKTSVAPHMRIIKKETAQDAAYFVFLALFTSLNLRQATQQVKIILDEHAHKAVQKYIEEVSRAGPFAVEIRTTNAPGTYTYWQPSDECDEYVIAASSEGWLRYTPLNNANTRCIVSTPRKTAPIKCSEQIFDFLQGHACKAPAMPKKRLVTDNSPLPIEKIAVSTESMQTMSQYKQESSKPQTQHGKKRTLVEAEFVPFEPNAKTLCRQ